jgi:hypothetical protein
MDRQIAKQAAPYHGAGRPEQLHQRRSPHPHGDGVAPLTAAGPGSQVLPDVSIGILMACAS